MWRPGQLVTINGVVYRVKRNHDSKGPCEKCALRCCGAFCEWDGSKKYLIPGNCYLERLSPVIKWGFNSPSPRGQF